MTGSETVIADDDYYYYYCDCPIRSRVFVAGGRAAGYGGTGGRPEDIGGRRDFGGPPRYYYYYYSEICRIDGGRRCGIVGIVRALLLEGKKKN